MGEFGLGWNGIGAKGRKGKKCEKEKEFAVGVDGAEVVVKLFC